MDFRGCHEIHLTIAPPTAKLWAAAQVWAGKNTAKCVWIELSDGNHPSQPMLTLRRTGSLPEMTAQCRAIEQELRGLGLVPVRTKIECDPAIRDVPEEDEEWQAAHAGRYFESHVKLRLEADEDLNPLRTIAEGQGARLSRNAFRQRSDGAREWFVTQRLRCCGKRTARRRLDELIASFRDRGYPIADVESEFVVFDSFEPLDAGWLAEAQPTGLKATWARWLRILGTWTAPHALLAPAEGASVHLDILRDLEQRLPQALQSARDRLKTPNTLLPVSDPPRVSRPRLFEPALLHVCGAYRHGDPAFEEPADAERWAIARRKVVSAILRHLADVPLLEEHLVLRGSLLMQCWFPSQAREPGDLDFVVMPPEIEIDGDEAIELFDSLISSLKRGRVEGDVVLQADAIRSDLIWAYDRVPGRRFLIPWQAGTLPVGTAQIDVVFGERLPAGEVAAESLSLADGSTVTFNAASRPISLAWKLQWLLTDMHPQGKDLYDAVLLAESTEFSRELLAEVLRRERHQGFPRGVDLGDIMGLTVEWELFQTEYPWVDGTRQSWLERLVEALRPAFV